MIGPFDHPGCVPPEHEQSEPPERDDDCACGGANWACDACWLEYLEACCEA